MDRSNGRKEFASVESMVAMGARRTPLTFTLPMRATRDWYGLEEALEDPLGWVQ